MALLKAIRYRSIDEARQVLQNISCPVDPFDDAGEEPQGLLTVVPEDRIPERYFSRLFDAKKGILVEVERIEYSGYGPPAEEDDYMGFVGEGVAYVLKGCRLPVEITNCPEGARDIHHLEALVLDRQHPLNREYVAQKLKLSPDWDFEDLFELILEGKLSGEEVDRVIHQGIQ